MIFATLVSTGLCTLAKPWSSLNHALCPIQPFRFRVAGCMRCSDNPYFKEYSSVRYAWTVLVLAALMATLPAAGLACIPVAVFIEQSAMYPSASRYCRSLGVSIAF